MNKNIAAVVILYYPPEIVYNNIQSYLEEIERLYIFDNSPNIVDKNIELLKRNEKVRYITQNKNVGIGVAINIAARKATDEGFNYLLTMDQDSCISTDMINKMMSVAKQYLEAGIITPLHIVENDVQIIPSQEYEVVPSAMTSGNILNLKIFNKIGGLNEDLFIDYIDHEYCLRLQQNGFSIIRVNTALLYHKVGSLEEKSFFWKKIHPTGHSPIRLYYQTRNLLYLNKIYRKQYPQFIKSQLSSFIRRILKIIFFEKYRIRKLLMVYKGFKAFLKKDFSSLEY